MPRRDLVCMSAFDVLRDDEAQPMKVEGSIVTSLPDADDMQMPIPQWYLWFTDAVRLCLEATPGTCMCVFYQTDRKALRRQIAKDRLIMQVARDLGYDEPLWHKIALTAPVGVSNLYRPSYSHMLAFSKQCGPGKVTPDVIDAGPKLYPDGMGVHAALFMARAVQRVSDHVTDPFCGRGTLLAAAHALGMHTLGVDIDPEQIRVARDLDSDQFAVFNAATTIA